MGRRRDFAPLRRIDKGSPIPFYYQLQEILKEEIEAGLWKSGEFLPSEAQLTAAFGVSRPVIRKALDILEGDGQIYRLKGRGTVLAPEKFRYEAIGDASTWASDVPVQLRLNRLLANQRVAGGGHVGRLLNLALGDEVLELTFSESVDSTVSSLTQMFIRPDALSGLPPGEVPNFEDGGSNALRQLQERYGFAIAESHLSVEATRTNPFEADLLVIEQGSPVFLLSSLDLGRAGRPVAFRRSIVRSDHFRFSLVIQRSEILEGQIYPFVKRQEGAMYPLRSGERTEERARR